MPTLPADPTPRATDRPLLDEVYRLDREHREAEQQPGAVARRMADAFNPARRILLAFEHAERQQRGNPHERQMQEALWAFQPFSMTVGELLLAALAGCAPNHPQLRTLRLGSLNLGGIGGLMGVGRTVPRAQLEQASAHVERYGQANEAMWPYQAFSLSYGELLLAALRA